MHWLEDFPPLPGKYLGVESWEVQLLLLSVSHV